MCLSDRHGQSRPESSDNIERWFLVRPNPVKLVCRSETSQRQPQVITLKRNAVKALRCNTDDLTSCTVDNHKLTDEIRIAAQPLPAAIT